MRTLVLLREILWKELQHHPWLAGAIFALWLIPNGLNIGEIKNAELVFVTPLLALGLGGRAVREEIKEKTMAVQFTRPMRRERLLLLKLAALTLILLGAMVAGVAMKGVVAWIWCHRYGAPFLIGFWQKYYSAESQELLNSGIASLFFLIAGIFSGLWMETAVGKIRQVLIVLAIMAAALVAYNLTRSDGITATIVFEVFGVILLGASLGFIRQMQIRG